MQGAKGLPFVKTSLKLQNIELDSGITDLNGKFTSFIEKSKVQEEKQIFQMTGTTLKFGSQTLEITKDAF